MNTDIVYYVLIALASLITLTVHEYSHGFVAYKLGDPTAKALGRLTLNPLKHLDIWGTLCMILFRFGWAKPVPINTRFFKKPKRDFALVALAGPTSNIICAIVVGFLYSLSVFIFNGKTFPNEFLRSTAENLCLFLYIFHIVNVGIALFNLIPIPPLDGSRILNVILPTKLYFKIMKYERIIYLVFITWLLLGSFVRRLLLLIPLVSSNPMLSSITYIFSLSDLIGMAVDGLSGLILNMFGLIFK